MIITAKFGAVCPTCGDRIAVGARVNWTRGAKATHAACSPAAVGSSAPRRTRGARYCEGWGADTPHAPRPPYTCTECGYDE